MNGNIPQHIIDNFKSTYDDQYPCINWLSFDDNVSFDIITPMLKKSTLIWYNTKVDYDENIVQYHTIREYYEYDKTGIHIYYNYNTNDKIDVFILSKLNKKDIVDLVLFNLKKRKKDGNNSK
jgi:hypothetical protein